MARMLSEFFKPKAISCKAFFKKFPKCPTTAIIEEVELQEVKAGGEQKLALKFAKQAVWISCNLYNAEKLAKKWGQDVDKWVGESIKIAKRITDFEDKEGMDITPI